MEVFPRRHGVGAYGATEAMGTVISPGEWLLKPGSVGRPFPGLIGQRPPRGRHPGRSRARWAPSTVSQFAGVQRSPTAATPTRPAEAYRDDLVTVGDLGHLDEHGYLFIADRRTDLIVSGGVNIYPAEVESALAADPDVVDSAVIGLPDPRMGQRVHAIVELRPGARRDDRHPGTTGRRTWPISSSPGPSSSWTPCRGSPTARSSNVGCRRTAPGDPGPSDPTGHRVPEPGVGPCRDGWFRVQERRTAGTADVGPQSV